MEKTKLIEDDGKYAELLSIAVTPNAKGLGIGRELIAHFESDAKARGCKKIALTTDYYNNDVVVAFYKKSGYKVFYEFTTYPNRKMYKLIKNLD
jgi:ribosomal protein S18 acetylase RimI-like enzyme